MTTMITTGILASDFNPDTSDRLRRRWQVGPMRHVIAELAGARVIIVADALTGMCLTDVALVATRKTPHGGTSMSLSSTRARIVSVASGIRWVVSAS